MVVGDAKTFIFLVHRFAHIKHIDRTIPKKPRMIATASDIMIHWTPAIDMTKADVDMIVDATEMMFINLNGAVGPAGIFIIFETGSSVASLLRDSSLSQARKWIEIAVTATSLNPNMINEAANANIEFVVSVSNESDPGCYVIVI